MHDGDDTRALVALLERLDQQDTMIEGLRHEVAALRDRVDGDVRRVGAGYRPPEQAGPPPAEEADRRTFFRHAGAMAAGAVAAGTVGVVGAAAPAGAQIVEASGDPAIKGIGTGFGTAILGTSSGGVGVRGEGGYGVFGESPNLVGVRGKATGAGTAGVYAENTATTGTTSHALRAVNSASSSATIRATNLGGGTALEAIANGAPTPVVTIESAHAGQARGLEIVLSTPEETSYALHASGNLGYGVIAESKHCQLKLGPWALSGNEGAPSLWPGTPGTSTIFHYPGEVVMDANKDLWVCVAKGTPGTWRRLAGTGTAGSLVVLATPKRVYDSRPGFTPNTGTKGQLAANTARSVDLKAASSGVPSGATAALLSLVATNTTGSGGGFLAVYRSGIAWPGTSNLNWSAPNQNVSVTTLTAVNASALCDLYASQATHAIVDVLGYYL